MDPFHWKELFSFSKRERRGIYTLLALLVLWLMIKGHLNDFSGAVQPQTDSAFVRQVEAWLDHTHREALSDSGPSFSGPHKDPPTSPAVLFRFDPNRACRAELKRLGLSARVVNNLLKYRKKGGVISTPGEMMKIYGMDSATYFRVKDSISIHPGADKSEMASPGPALYAARDASVPVNIDLNAADTLQLMRLTGIGPVFARRICKYRDLLGGYVHMDQLHEVYGMDGRLVDSIQEHLYIDTLQVRPIALNETTFSELIRHPYLDVYHTKAILNYLDYRREKLGHINELLINNILDIQTYTKMKPYLVTDPQDLSGELWD